VNNNIGHIAISAYALRLLPKDAAWRLCCFTSIMCILRNIMQYWLSEKVIMALKTSCYIANLGAWNSYHRPE
jgi:hypothetical protein